MQAFMKRYRLWAPCVLGLLSLALALYALFSLAAVSGHYQYLWPAPAPVAVSGGNNAGTGDSAGSDTGKDAKTVNTGLREARQGMEALNEQLEGACEGTTLFAVADGASVIAKMDNATAITARVEAIDDGAYQLKPITLKSGRLIYSDELITGEHVAMVDEKLAVALFNYAEPTDRVLLLGDEKYRIVGIVNDAKRVGDHQEYTLYVPYRAVEKTSQVMDALCVETSPIRGAGGWSAFETATASLSTRGTAISLPKEAMNAALPLRVLVCLFGMMAVLFAIRALSVQSMALYRGYRTRLQEQYAVRLLPWLAWRAVLLGLGYAACAVVFAQVFMVLVEPVYTFPEWIPTVLVEPKDISTAFWNVWQKQASLFELRSPELQRIRFFRSVMGWACGGLTLAGGMLAARMGDAMRRLTTKPQKAQETEEKVEKFSME